MYKLQQYNVEKENDCRASHRLDEVLTKYF